MNNVQVTFPIKAESYLPHRGAMCCIDEILDSTESAISVKTLLHPEHALLTGEGVLERSGFIELAAQAGCALMGLTASSEQSSAVALLVGVQDVVVHHDAVVDDILLISVCITSEISEIRLVDFEIENQQHLLATGTLKVFYQA